MIGPKQEAPSIEGAHQALRTAKRSLLVLRCVDSVYVQRQSRLPRRLLAGERQNPATSGETGWEEVAMSKAKAEDDTIAGVAGVRFTTDARPGSAQEAQLQRIQYSLSGGVDILPSQTTLPHLAMSAAAAVGGGPRTSSSVISLWVPKDQRAEATKQLEAAGFTVS